MNLNYLNINILHLNIAPKKLCLHYTIMRQLDEGAKEIYTKRVSKNKTADEWKSSQLLKAWHCVPKILKTHKASDKLEPSRKKRPSNSTYLGRVKYYRQKDKNAVRLTGICSQTV